VLVSTNILFLVGGACFRVHKLLLDALHGLIIRESREDDITLGHDLLQRLSDANLVLTKFSEETVRLVTGPVPDQDWRRGVDMSGIVAGTRVAAGLDPFESKHVGVVQDD